MKKNSNPSELPQEEKPNQRQESARRQKPSIPSWIKMQVPGGKKYTQVKKAVNSRNLNTVCLQANCPNIGDCLCLGTVTFMIMGSHCTRNCRYCAVTTGNPEPLNLEEPTLIAEAIKELDLTYAVITSVTRDDLPDGGAQHFANTISEIKRLNPQCKVEVLVPDFKGSQKESLDIIYNAKPDVFNHNIEVVPSLFPKVRAQGNFQLSLKLLSAASKLGMKVKSGMMIGLGETRGEIEETLEALFHSGVKILTIGQYLRSSKENLPVSYYYKESYFEELKEKALKIGFNKVASGAMVRSSWHAAEIAQEDKEDEQ